MNEAGDIRQATVAVIGCGNIGSRCLQAIAGLGPNVTAYAVEPFEAAIAIARKRYEEVASKESPPISYLSEIKELPREINLALIATCADIRLSVASALLDHASVQHLILEKFLFQRFSEYQEMAHLIDTNAVSCSVNLVRRSWPGYQSLRNLFVDGEPVEMHVTGKDFRLASNAIHLLDLYAYISGQHVDALDGSGLTGSSASSHRQDYREVYGTLRGQTENGGNLSLSSYASGEVPFTVQFSSPSVHCIVHEGEGRMRIAGAGTGGKWNDLPFQGLYMSEMAPVFAALLNGQPCALPVFSDTAPDHIALIEVLNRYWFGDDWKEFPCPVT